MLECRTYMLPGLTYEGSSSFQSIFQAEKKKETSVSVIIQKQTSYILLEQNHPIKKHMFQNICSKFRNICETRMGEE